MPVLAIAGGTSPTLGRAIISAMLTTKPANNWTAVLLSRNNKVPLWLRALDSDGKRTQIRVVDYFNVGSIATALDKVHTLVSVVATTDGTQGQIEVNLFQAAVDAGCKRVAPSQFGFGVKSYDNIDFMKEGGSKIAAAIAEHKGKIEVGRFHNGAFMNYLGHGIYPVPTPASDDDSTLQSMREGNGYVSGEDEAVEGLQRAGDLKDGSGGFLLGMRNLVAQLPVKDNGEWPRAAFTTVRDVGRFIAAALDLPKWEENMNIVGDTVSMGELLAYAEEITGQKFEVEKITREQQLKKFAELDPSDWSGAAFGEFRLAFIREQDEEGLLRPVVNGLCPSVKPIKVREYLEKHWKN